MKIQSSKLGTVLIFFLIFLICLLLTSAFDASKEQSGNRIVIAVGPHHLVAKDLIHLPFDTLKTYGEKDITPQEFDEVIIVGPNHFDLGNYPALTANQSNLRFKGFNLSPLAEKLADSRLVKATEGIFHNEHSIYTYLPVVRNYYPKAKITPLILQWNFPRNLVPELARYIAKIISGKNKTVLILFSIDFSHYQSQKVAKLHDIKSQGVLHMLEKSEAHSLEVDCRACISLMLELAEIYKLYPLDVNGTKRLTNKSSFDFLGYDSPEGQTTYFSGVLLEHGTKAKKRPVTILAFGDLLLDRGIRTVIDKNGEDTVFEKLAGMENRFFEGTDIIYANLETAVVQDKVASGKEIVFQSKPDFLEVLRKHNINLVSVANNHTYDAGKNGFIETLENLRKYNISSVGDPKQVSPLSSLQIEKGGYKIGFVALNNTDFRLNVDEALALIKQIRAENNFVIISIHWGIEYSHLPTPFQKELATKMVDFGADVIIGHHPHVLQGMEFIDGRPVFYSLGNFVFDQWFSDATQETIALGISLNKPALYDENNVSLHPPDIDLYFTPLQLEGGLPFEPGTEKASTILNKFYNYSHTTNSGIENHHFLFQ